MIRLLYSSKFWALAVGAIALIAQAVFGVQNEQADVLVKQVLVAYAAIAPVVYAIMTGLEDAFADGQVSLEELIELVKDIINQE